MFSANSPHAAEGRSPVPPRCYTYKSTYTRSLAETCKFCSYTSLLQCVAEAGRSTRTVSADTDAPRLEARPADTSPTGRARSREEMQPLGAAPLPGPFTGESSGPVKIWNGGIAHVNYKVPSVTAFARTYDERGEGTSLRSEVKKARVTSHQGFGQIGSKKLKKKSEIQAKTIFNKRSDVP
jgi:hypothetical protein